MLTQTDPNAVDGGFEYVATLSRGTRAALDGLGVTFAEESEFDEPGPTQWAVVTVDDEAQYLLVHHYAHPEAFVELRASIRERNSDRAIASFLDAAGLADSDVLDAVAPSDWPPSSH